MKKIVVLLLCALSLATPEASAQKWLKKIGKAAGEVLMTPSTSNSSSKTSSNSARAVFAGIGNATLTNNVPGLDITLRSVERINNTAVKIDMVLMNTTSGELILHNANQYGGIYTSDGDECGNATLIIGSNYSYPLTKSSGNFWNATLPSNVPVKASIVVEKVPQNTFTFSMVKFMPTQHNGGGVDYPIEIRNLTVPEMPKQVFKGIWEKTEDNGDYGEVSAIIDINLYAKTVENMYGDFGYGIIAVVSSTGKILYTYNITAVKSIDGNTATVTCYDEMNDCTFDTVLKYTPNTDTMCFDNLCISRK